MLDSAMEVEELESMMGMVNLGGDTKVQIAVVLYRSEPEDYESRGLLKSKYRWYVQLRRLPGLGERGFGYSYCTL